MRILRNELCALGYAVKQAGLTKGFELCEIGTRNLIQKFSADLVYALFDLDRDVAEQEHFGQKVYHCKGNETACQKPVYLINAVIGDALRLPC